MILNLRLLETKKLFTNRLKNTLDKSEELTKKNNKLQINLALNYGSKNEIVNAIKILNRKKTIINEQNIQEKLYTSCIPDPDILIRTGNTNRLSNFLLWQLAYTEFFFLKKCGQILIQKTLSKY